MRGAKLFKSGTRVRLRSPSAALELEADTGRVVGPDRWEGYFIVRLDRPARYRHADGHWEELMEVREAADNMEVLRPSKEAGAPAG